VPHHNRKIGLAFGLEGFFNTASHPSLGTGRNVLGPQVLLVFHDIATPVSTFAPALQYMFHVDDVAGQPDINQTIVDLYIAWISPIKRRWGVIDPQILIDHEKGETFGQVEIELGQLMFGMIGGYIRPGFGVGSDRIMDWNLEMGVMLIWK
jgi:hypothetical protein